MHVPGQLFVPWPLFLSITLLGYVGIEDVCLIAVRQKNTRYLFIRLDSCVVLEIQVSQQSLSNVKTKKSIHL